MPPYSDNSQCCNASCTHDDLLHIAATELEGMRRAAEKSLKTGEDCSRSFPPACLALLQDLPGNQRCIDCGEFDASWASVSYGVVMCLRCSGRHRGLGVKTSYIKSLTMDSWNHTQILSMLEGGNKQLSEFFSRHKMGNGDRINCDRYKTKAALFYRHHLSNHAKEVADSGLYQGREASRSQSAQRKKASASSDKNLQEMRPRVESFCTVKA